MSSLDDWKHAATLGPAPAEPSLNETQRLRAEHGAGVAAAMIELSRAREKLAAKMPSDLAGRWLADVAGAEMATSHAAAAHKARRYANEARVQDLCCGIGMDASAIGRHASVVGIDLDPVRAWMCSVNASCEGLNADVTRAFDPAIAFHADPSRRSSQGKRAWSIEDYEPGGNFIRTLAEHDGGIKLGPGVTLSDLPEGEVEIISERGRLTQAMLWTGRFAGASRRATLLGSDGAVSVEGVEGEMDVAPGALGLVATYDPSLERLGLGWRVTEPLGVRVVADQRTGLLTADERRESPWLTWFEVLEETAWNEKVVKKKLRGFGAGLVEVKTRGKAVEPDALQKRLRCGGDRTLTLFVLKFGGPLRAVIARRL